jgi:hypothetical protein
MDRTRSRFVADPCVHGRRPLEAEALSQNRVDDVDLDMRVGAQVGDRGRGCEVGEEQPFVVPQPGGALRRQIRQAVRRDGGDEPEPLFAHDPLHLAGQLHDETICRDVFSGAAESL